MPTAGQATAEVSMGRHALHETLVGYNARRARRSDQEVFWCACRNYDLRAASKFFPWHR
jgi:hypothetical protein